MVRITFVPEPINQEPIHQEPIKKDPIASAKPQRAIEKFSQIILDEKPSANPKILQLALRISLFITAVFLIVKTLLGIPPIIAKAPLFFAIGGASCGLYFLYMKFGSKRDL